MATTTSPAHQVAFKNPPKDLGLNRPLPNGNILMFFGGNKTSDKALSTIVLDVKTNVAWLNTWNKKTRREFNAPVYALLRKPGTSMFNLCQIAAATGIAYVKPQYAAHKTR